VPCHLVVARVEGKTDGAAVLTLGSCYQVGEVQCGGGHRDWALGISLCEARDSIQSFACAFVQQQEITVYTRPPPAHDGQNLVLRGRWHGREVVAGTVMGIHGPTPALVTASEDTSVAVTALACTGAGAQLELEVDAASFFYVHDSGPRCVAACDEMGVVVTGGGREMIAVWAQTTTPAGTLTLQCLQCFTRGVAAASESDAASQRIMGLAAFSVSASVLCIVAGVSDAHVRTFLWDTAAPERLVLVHESAFHARCPLAVGCLPRPLPAHAQTWAATTALTGATDGRIAVWDCSAPVDAFREMRLVETGGTRHWVGSDHRRTSAGRIRWWRVCSGVRERRAPHVAGPVFAFQAHQSGVNSISMLWTDRGGCLVLSGGDDNSVVVSMVTATCGRGGACDYALAWQTRHGPAHAAPVTACIAASATCLLTASVDQRLNVWSVAAADAGQGLEHTQSGGDVARGAEASASAPPPELELVGSIFTNVADIAGLDVVRPHPPAASTKTGGVVAVVVGVGVEMVHVAAT